MWLPGRGGSTTTSHATAGTVNVSCGLCHGGTALTGGSVAYPGGIAPPSCFPASSINGTLCHFTKPVDNQGITVGCGSCHGAIPQNANTKGLPNGDAALGATSPNRDFRHSEHFSTTNNLAGLACSACHTGNGSGTTTHAISPIPATAPTAIGTLFSEGASPAAYSPVTQKCSNVSCHGTKTAAFPAWQSTVAFDQAVCINCHLTITPINQGVAPSAYTGPYIGPFSGDNISFNDPPTNTIPSFGYFNLHNLHARFPAAGATPWEFCTRCHEAPGIGHYASIALGKRLLTPGFAASTIRGPDIVSYTNNNTTPSSSSCVAVAGCHINPLTPRSWYK
jgi:predicted CxxxxCH...CXXCH cytochrome family protein